MLPGQDREEDEPRYLDGFRGLKLIGYQNDCSFECGCRGNREEEIPKSMTFLRACWAKDRPKIVDIGFLLGEWQRQKHLMTKRRFVAWIFLSLIFLSPMTAARGVRLRNVVPDAVWSVTT